MTRSGSFRLGVGLLIWAGVLVLNGFPDVIPKAARDGLTAPAPVWLVLVIWWFGTSQNMATASKQEGRSNPQ